MQRIGIRLRPLYATQSSELERVDPSTEQEPLSTATPAPSSSSIAAVILASAISGTLLKRDTPSATHAAIINFVAECFAPETEMIPSSGPAGCRCQERLSAIFKSSSRVRVSVLWSSYLGI